MGRGKDYTNKKFGNLTAIRRVDDYIQTNGIRRVRCEFIVVYSQKEFTL